MASRLLRRSGRAVGLVAEQLGWRADVIYQVGVGIHHEEIDVLKAEWPGCELVGFEPNPEICDSIGEKYPGQLVNCALGEGEYFATLYANVRHKDGSTIRIPQQLKDVKHKEHRVEVYPLDLFPRPKENTRVLFWLDCEGMELEVLCGGRDFVKYVQVVNVELTSNPAAEGWCSPLAVHDWLVDHGFFLQWIHTQRVHIAQRDGIYVRPELFREEFCCCPYTVREWRDWRAKQPVVVKNA